MTLALAVGGVLYLSYVDGDATYCALDGADSNYGEASLSLWPPGPECEYTASLNGVDRVDSPGPATSIWIVTVAAMTVVLVSTRRSRARSSVERDRAGLHL
jgi:hypothetical protein